MDMFFFWGPFFFIFPILLVYLIIHTLTSVSRHRSPFHSLFERERGTDIFDMWENREMDEHRLQVKVYQLAYRLKGSVTVSDIVVETGLSAEEAEKLIGAMVDNQRIRMEVKDDGMVFYEFPEIISRYKES